MIGENNSKGLNLDLQLAKHAFQSLELSLQPLQIFLDILLKVIYWIREMLQGLMHLACAFCQSQFYSQHCI